MAAQRFNTETKSSNDATDPENPMSTSNRSYQRPVPLPEFLLENPFKAVHLCGEKLKKSKRNRKRKYRCQVKEIQEIFEDIVVMDADNIKPDEIYEEVVAGWMKIAAWRDSKLQELENEQADDNAKQKIEKTYEYHCKELKSSYQFFVCDINIIQALLEAIRSAIDGIRES